MLSACCRIRSHMSCTKMHGDERLWYKSVGVNASANHCRKMA